MLCNQCHETNNADGIAALQWLTGDPFRVVLVSTDALRAYGATVRGDAVAIPMYAADGAQCSTFTIWPHGDAKQRKGLSAKGAPVGFESIPVATRKPKRSL
jgi:hypothetical protein